MTTTDPTHDLDLSQSLVAHGIASRLAHRGVTAQECDAIAAAISDALLSHGRAVRREALEDACRAACSFCAAGHAVVAITSTRWVHAYATLSDVPCTANHIHPLMEADNAR